MKTKIFNIILIAIMILGLTGCGNSSEKDKKGDVPTASKPKVFNGYKVGNDLSDGKIKDGMVIVSKDGYFGAVDLKGNFVVKCDTYTKMYDYSNGMAMVEKGGKYGFVDTKGNLVVPLEYDYFYGGTNEFSKTDDVAWVKKNDKWGIVNKKGEVVKEPTLDYGSVMQFVNGYASISPGFDNKCVDTKGNEVDYNTYCKNNNSKEEFPKIKSIKNEEGLWGYEDENGKLVVDYKYKYTSSFNEGVAKATLPDDTIEIINEKGDALLIFK